MDVRIRKLETENARLRAENEQLRREVRELQATVEPLNGTIARLKAALEADKRAGKRQAAPFRKFEPPMVEPKKPGRKKGRPNGKHAHRVAPALGDNDETHEAPLPRECRHCSGRRIERTHTVLQDQTEIPRRPIRRQFTIHCGTCQDCGQSLRGRHSLRTSGAVGAPAANWAPTRMPP